MMPDRLTPEVFRELMTKYGFRSIAALSRATNVPANRFHQHLAGGRNLSELNRRRLADVMKRKEDREIILSRGDA
jgi:hypothetical protein